MFFILYYDWSIVEAKSIKSLRLHFGKKSALLWKGLLFLPFHRVTCDHTRSVQPLIIHCIPVASALNTWLKSLKGEIKKRRYSLIFRHFLKTLIVYFVYWIDGFSKSEKLKSVSWQTKKHISSLQPDPYRLNKCAFIVRVWV